MKIHDRSLRTRLESYSSREKDFWSFRGNAAREHAHVYFQYPAMMVPQMQAELLQAALADDCTVQHVFDPFVGAGTALTESMMQGLSFTGSDVNPLAVLLCRAKSIPHYCQALNEKINRTLERVRTDGGRSFECSFPGRNKWFRHDVTIMLSRIRRAVRSEPCLWARRFLWVAVAETVRLSSNSRTSTFKLHVRPTEERDQRPIRPLEIFEAICKRNFSNFEKQKKLLADRGHLNRGIYRGAINAVLGDSANLVNPRGQFDMLLTSPPYGDNTSTIPYGQHSYLPLQWIDLQDIDPKLNGDCLRTTHEIDARSLGGSRAIDQEQIEQLRSRSKSAASTLGNLRNEPRDRLTRVVAFCRDLDRSLDSILAGLRSNGLMVWTVGNRRVAGRSVPLDRILSELLTARGCRPVLKIERKIPSKRTALRNSVSSTMRRETILVMRKHE